MPGDSMRARARALYLARQGKDPLGVTGFEQRYEVQVDTLATRLPCAEQRGLSPIRH